MIGAWRKVGRAQWTWNLTEDREGLRLTCVREAITPSLRSSVSRFTDGMSLLIKEIQRLKDRAKEKETTDNRFSDHIRKYVRYNM